MGNNNQTNNLIKWAVIAGDFVLLNLLLLAVVEWHPQMGEYYAEKKWLFVLANNLALIASEYRFYTVIHRRLVNVGKILPRIVGLTMTQALATWLVLKSIDYQQRVAGLLLLQGTAFFTLLLMVRFLERWIVKVYRQAGRNTRHVTLVGDDAELTNVKRTLLNDATLGYRIVGEYADPTNFLAATEAGTENTAALGDELYLCVSRREQELVRRISNLCDRRLVRFYYVPVSPENMGITLKREWLDDTEIYTTYENPLQNPVNRMVKRLFDIALSVAFLIPSAALLPVVWGMIRKQSPGPLFFRQERTGLDGKSFKILKFRSMHVNKDADRLQATKDDPRKFPFGDFMRKTNIDELPQFWNVLTGSMSIVGPRPHMLAHTEQYARLIDKYMVRHLVKPGITGWAQVTGFRGETRELWQMEGRVKRDIWYMEHWCFWLDIRIVWLTVKSMFVHDKNAY